jgi:hypothetical protein
MTEQWHNMEPYRPAGTKSQLEVRREDAAMSTGAFGTVYPARVRSAHSNRNTLGLPAVVKKIHVERAFTLDRVKELLSMFGKIRKAGIPTMGFFRGEVIDGEASFVMSDLSEEGKYLVLSANNVHHVVKPESVKRIDRLQQLVQQMCVIALQGAQTRLQASPDAYLFRFDPNVYARNNVLKAHDVFLGDFDRMKEVSTIFPPDELLRTNLIQIIKAFDSFVDLYVMRTADQEKKRCKILVLKTVQAFGKKHNLSITV